MSSFCDSINCHRLISDLMLVLGEACSELPKCPRINPVPLDSTFLCVGGRVAYQALVFPGCLPAPAEVTGASFMLRLKCLGWLRIHSVLESLVRDTECSRWSGVSLSQATQISSWKSEQMEEERMLGSINKYPSWARSLPGGHCGGMAGCSAVLLLAFGPMPMCQMAEPPGNLIYGKSGFFLIMKIVTLVEHGGGRTQQHQSSPLPRFASDRKQPYPPPSLVERALVNFRHCSTR